MNNIHNEEAKQEELLAEKIRTYSAALYKLALIRLKNEQDAEDVVQEVFYSYIRESKEFLSQEHERAWFIKVTLNACRKVFRSAWNKHRSELPEGFSETYADPGELPDAAYIRREVNTELAKVIWELPGKYREVIHLFYYEELSVKEIAAVCDRPEATVTSQLTRGRGILKKKLKEDYRFEEFRGSV